MKRFKKIPLALTSLAVIVVTAAAWARPSLSPANGTDALTLGFTSCNGWCIICREGPNGPEYALTTAGTGDPDAYFEVTVYCSEHYLGDCDIFDNCGQHFASAYESLSQALTKGRLDDVEQLLRKFKDVAYIAEERSAIQVLDCRNEVATQIALTSNQLRSLTSS
ncbi:MAG TPA: hypothetical protein VK864_08700 [Longimicrobiales bacterium]|nr:hypothetical protein [Longimicrobiales bacterium]